MSGKSGSLRRTAIPQPSYDFLGGSGDHEEHAGNSPPRALRQTFRQSSRPPPAATVDNEDLRAQLKSARYEVESLKQEREVARVRYEKELRDAQARAEADFQKAQTFESNKNVTAGRYEQVVKEMQELQNHSTNIQRDLEKRLRNAQSQGKESKEEAEEAQAELASAERQWSHRFQELEKKHDALQQTMRELKDDLNMKSSNLEATQTRLKSRDAEVGEMEAEILQLKAVTGDVDELATVRNQLTEQVEHIRKLEIANREQTSELRVLRQSQKSLAIVEEEKRTLQLKLGRLDNIEKELDEAKYQRQLLEDERKAWTSYLEGDSTDVSSPEFDSPEAMARALRNERMEKASLLERFGAVQPQIVEKEGLISALAEEKNKLQAEVARLKSSSANAGSTGGTRAIARLERQKALAVKEIEYLREQLRTFDAEDLTGEIKTDEEETFSARITELENLLGSYREELDTANTQLNSVEAPVQPSLKRPAPDTDHEQLSAQMGELSRKARKLQQDLSDVQNERVTLLADNTALKSQISALQASARTRVLSLRNNPTDDFEARKFSTVGLLRRENAALQAQLAGHVGSRRKGDVVPAESLEEAKLQIEEALAQVRSREKLNERLKQVFAAKSQEMREAVASLLGWNVEFQPNGKFRLTSIFAADGHQGRGGGGGGGGKGGSDDTSAIERHITFHGEKGTMTIAGGPDGEFGREIRGLIRFWVEERNEIPGFLAAYTIENLERGREDDWLSVHQTS